MGVRTLFSLITIGAAFPLPAAAQQSDMCAALSRIAAAANEPVPFASLENTPASLVPGYRYCRIETGTAARAGAVSCHMQLAPKSLMAEVVGQQVRDCLGAEPAPRERYSRASNFQTATLLISVESHCDERCHVGRIASLRIARRRDD